MELCEYFCPLSVILNNNKKQEKQEKKRRKTRRKKYLIQAWCLPAKHAKIVKIRSVLNILMSGTNSVYHLVLSCRLYICLHDVQCTCVQITWSYCTINPLLWSVTTEQFTKEGRTRSLLNILKHEILVQYCKYFLHE